MTDVKSSGRQRLLRGLPLLLEDNVFDLIAEGHAGLRHGADPNLASIARAAYINKQRLSDIYNGNVTVPGSWTMGALVRCHAQVHGITDKQAMAAILRVGDLDEAMAL